MAWISSQAFFSYSLKILRPKLFGSCTSLNPVPTPTPTHTPPTTSLLPPPTEPVRSSPLILRRLLPSLLLRRLLPPTTESRPPHPRQLLRPRDRRLPTPRRRPPPRPPPDPSSSDRAAPEILSLAWTRSLLDSFLICLEEFRAILFGGGAAAASCPPLDHLLADFLDCAVKALDLCNALRDGLDLIRQWRKHLAIAAAALASPAPAAPLGEGQIRRARKALTDLTILMLDDKGGSGGVVGQRNRSFGHGNRDGHGHGHGHHRRSSSGGSSGSSSSSHFRSLSWSVSRSWSAARQLQAIGGGLPVPRTHDIAATGGLASAVHTMGDVLFVVAWALVATIPCQDRGLQAHFSVPRSFPWAGPVTTLYERILEESKKKERKHSCGLLKEIHQIERCSRQLMEITDASQFPLAEKKDAEVREAAQELVQVCESLKDGLDPLERQLREMFHRIVRTRTDILDSLSRPHNTE